ncbi:hypothetical protein [Flammeovirga aprica]|uniref:Uncharacterized protein n=1 Tax=Flammeovirga aprica JL-4 TaxID=694437 RepID=A0A7X9RVY4_9BACT|nr:hypothetical protein [Flammeovirga aprica]NME69722.1 hypothetical protein [Flammeovirga aprica JL-4]
MKVEHKSLLKGDDNLQYFYFKISVAGYASTENRNPYKNKDPSNPDWITWVHLSA